MHANGTAIEDAQVILLNSITGYMLNKPRPGLPPEEQKTLIKIQYREIGSLDMTDRVVDFTGDDRFVDVMKCESLLKERAGDKAEERRQRVKLEADRISGLRTQFLLSNPDVNMMFDYLTSPEGGGLSADEFWEQYKDQLLDMETASQRNGSVPSVPAPLRRPDMIQNDVSANLLIQSADRKNELNVTPEKASEIFTQFPKAKELYDQFVPAAMSEKNFWKRFFQSQYFNIAQGRTLVGQTAGTVSKDTVFDFLSEEASTNVPQLRPGEILVNPEIDLSIDWAVAESGVFTYREGGADQSDKVETSGKVPSKDSVPHSALIKRFNQYSSKSLQQVPQAVAGASGEENLVNNLRKRIEIMEGEIDSEIRLSSLQLVEEPAVSKAEIERLRTARNIVQDPVSWSSFQGKMKDVTTIVPGLEGVASATIELTTELVSPLTVSAGAELTRRMKKISLTDENQEMNDYVDRVAEILRFYYSCKLADKEKRDKLISSLNKIKNELNNSFIPKARFASEWTSTVAMLNGIISNVEIINANIS